MNNYIKSQSYKRNLIGNVVNWYFGRESLCEFLHSLLNNFKKLTKSKKKKNKVK